jgi:menaquinone-dependent protoporphyrinogen oxidase
MNVLIAVASKHGSTREIAKAIADVLRTEGFEVTVAEPADVTGLDNVQAVVIGSALYFGQWQPDAISFVRRFADRLETIPVWTFSSGNLGLHHVDQPANILQHMTLSHAMEHRLFGGCLNESKLDSVEKILVRNLDVTNRDERDWNEIRAWAKTIAATLQEMPPLDELRSTTMHVAEER